MAQTAHRGLSIADWLAFDDGTDQRYELVDGRLVAMAPATSRHGTIAHNAAAVIDAAVADRPPCRPVHGAGLEVQVGDERRGYIADVLLTCEPASDTQVHLEPRLIVEILSPSTAGVDKRRKTPDYSLLPSVEEIWLIDSRARAVLVWRRAEGTWIGSFPYTGDNRFESPVLGTTVELDRLYRNTGL